MMEYRDVPLRTLVDLAETSCAELGATGGNWVINYETGKPFEAPDYDTALFLASAREIVLELAHRLQSIENPYSHLSKTQHQILKVACSEYGTSIHTWEETKLRQALEMVDEGLLTKSLDIYSGRNYFFFITVKGRSVLDALAFIDPFKSEGGQPR
jgi:DNA-binding MarR family transcriptional regulator